MESENNGLPFESSLEPSSFNVEQMVAPALVLDSSGADRIVSDFNEADYQRHRNIYVSVHLPHSHSKHHKSHRHKRRHSHHTRHGSGHGHHGDGQGDGQSYHGDEDDVDNLQDHQEDLDASYLSETRPPFSRGRNSLMSNYGRGEQLECQPRYKKSHSLPTGHFSPLEKRMVQVDPVTPSDPCDRVKFILGGDHEDQADTEGAHNIFTELEELKYDQHEHRMEWKETARWIKFEEDVEEGGNKWSKPHVATLSLHSLFELRGCIFKGTVLLDLHADNLAMISDIVLDNLVSTGQLEEESRDKVRGALLQRHHHLNSKKDHGENKLLEHIKSIGEIGRHNSRDLDGIPINGNTGSLFGSRNGSRRGSILGDIGTRDGSIAGIRLEEDDPEHDQTTHNKLGSNFMKKIPPGSEASNVLVGEVDFLSHSIIAFVRLARGMYLGDLTEVPIPTRFIFIMLGPTGHQERYHEIGRSISTLMSDEVFHEVAYKARNRGDLMAGIDEFLDKVTVLPPGEWDPQIRLEPPSKVPSQANRKNTTDPTKTSNDMIDHPYKCKHCKVPMDHPPPIKWNKRPFQGILEDTMRCYALYRSDLSDAFSLQSIASLILIYFANITLAFTFGAILYDHTEMTLGATETILAVGISNFIYSIFSGQPLVILGPTGPTLIFEQFIFRFCNMNDIPFLQFRFWIGLWTAIFMFVLVGFNTSAITRLFTRFTEEVFTVSIGFFFIYLAFRALYDIHLQSPYNEWLIYPTKRRVCDCYKYSNLQHFKDNNLTNSTNLGSFWDEPMENCSKILYRRYVGDGCPTGFMDYHDVFLMSLILFFGTFMFCIYFKKIRNSKFFNLYFRSLLSDFAVFIAVVVWVVVDVLAQVDTPKLVVPNVFTTGVYSYRNRSFIINPLGHDLPLWAPGAALIPAIFATILFFIDQHITSIIVNRKDNKLKKNTGYHLDLFIIGCLIFLHSLLGLPWVVGATILSISHVQSLYLYSTHIAPGERPQFIGVREQRVTLFFMAILVGISVMAYRVLILLPLPVLYGLVLYLGVTTLYGVQFIQRVKLFFIPNKHRPDYKYLRHVPNSRIYIYTIIQIVFLLLLCIFQVYFYLQIMFPLMVVTLVIGRWLLGFVFSKHDLEFLDDPIPDSLYSRCCMRTASCLDPESNNGSSDTFESAQSSSQDAIAVTSEPVSSRCHHHHDDDFNLTREVDKCDLWKNMVKHLDAPPPSPRTRLGSYDRSVARTQERSLSAATVVAMDTNRELGPLEECDTDLESQLNNYSDGDGMLSPDWKEEEEKFNEPGGHLNPDLDSGAHISTAV